MEVLKLPSDGSCKWAGMGDYQLISPNESIAADVKYIGEPPHGDSYHSLTISGKKLPGYVWGCLFAFSADSRYLVCSWMEKLVERKTIVIDCEKHQYFLLPEYIYNFSVNWPSVKGNESKWEGLSYEFTGNEVWLKF